MGKKVLVTGGLGFIGHQVVRYLEKNDCEVCVVDPQTDYTVLSSAHLSTLYNLRKQSFFTNNIHDLNVVDHVRLQRVFGDFKPEIVVHMSSFPRQKTVESAPLLACQTMCEGVVSTLEASVAHGVERFVFISSSMVYGDFHDAIVGESHEKNPMGTYGILKLTGEKLVEDYAKNTGMDYVIIRPSAVYGINDMNDRVVAKFLVNALRDEVINVRGADELIDLTFVTDTASGIVGASLSEHASKNTYNITRGRARTLLEAAEIAVKISGKGQVKVEERDASMPSRGTLDIANASTDFGYNPQVDIEQGFEIYMNWLTETGLWK